jgi:ABC-type uncharacterized transport system auxiliary subunit
VRGRTSTARPAFDVGASALLVALLAALGGCIRGSLPAIELYRLDAPVGIETTDLARGGMPLLDGGIAVAEYRAPGIYGDAAIPYRVGETQYGTYPSREWAIPLGVMLGIATQRVLEARPITTGAAVYEPPNERLSTYVWRGTIREFEEVDRGAEVWAAVALDVQLVRSADDSVLWSGTLRREARVPDATMAAIVAALSRLATEGIADLAEQARAEVVRGARAAARP